MGTRNTMVSSYHSKIRSTQNKEVTFVFCFGHGLQCYLAIETRSQKFLDAGGFAELGHFDKHFVKNTQKKGSFGNIFGVFFSSILLKLHFEWKIKPKNGHNHDLFFKIWVLLNFLKRTGKESPPSSP